jgi:heparan-alpha-glucosaminide N-acetyltransferase
MTFVDLVFPAFLFLVGMSVPFALGGRLEKGEPVWKVLRHVAVRTGFLLLIGILMVHETPDDAAMGWSGNWWCVVMYFCSILALCSVSPNRAVSGSALLARKTAPKAKETAAQELRGSIQLQAREGAFWNGLSRGLRIIGLASLVWLAFAFRGPQGQRIVTITPLALHTEWYGILGLIGWAYLVTSITYLAFRGRRTAILGSMVLLMCLYAANRTGQFEGFWLGKIVGIGETLGSLPAISVGGLLLGSILYRTGRNDGAGYGRFTFWFVSGCAAAAMLLNKSYGISKNSATPSWCLWACAITAALWYLFYLICDAHPVQAIARPLQLAGNNVLLAYLLSEMLPGLLAALHLDNAYQSLSLSLGGAIVRSVLCGLFILVLATRMNRLGFRVRL